MTIMTYNLKDYKVHNDNNDYYEFTLNASYYEEITEVQPDGHLVIRNEPVCTCYKYKVKKPVLPACYTPGITFTRVDEKNY
jgi:hypothetical protein